MSQGQHWREQLHEAAAQGDTASLLKVIRSAVAERADVGDYTLMSRLLKRIGRDEASRAGLRPVRVYIARSVTVESWLPYLAVEAAAAGFWLETKVGGYGSFAQELMSPEGALRDFNPDLVVFVTDVEDVAGGLPDACATGKPELVRAEVERGVKTMEDMLTAFRHHHRARLLVQGLCVPDPPVLGDAGDANWEASESRATQRINEQIAALCRRLGDAAFFDENRLASRFGKARWRDERMFRYCRLSIAAEFFAPYARALTHSTKVLFLPPHKVLCTDLDNTLWGGIVGEDKPSGILTGTDFPGNCYRTYQRYLKQLAARGILLAVVSKNNEKDVREAFRVRAQDLALTLDDFVSLKISWQDKAVSLRELAQELSLGLDSFVLIDDDSVECEAVRQQVPGVLVIQAPREEPWRLTECVMASGAFDTLSVTAEDRARSDEYRAQAQRAQLENRAASREEFLASLQIVCRFISALEAPLSRTVQLINKTNQFNLTTRRYGTSEVESFAADPGGLALALRARDRFGDAGVIGIALCRTQDGTCTIDTLLLSCRVIGRGIESALLWYIARWAASLGANRLAGEYIPTAKNQPCADFYPRHGFRPAREAGGKQSRICYVLDLATQMPEKPAWIQTEEDLNNEPGPSCARVNEEFAR